MSYSFQSAGLLAPCVGLFLGILSDTVVNGIVSLISLFDLLLLAYRNATDFFVLILYPAALSESLTRFSGFLVAS